MDNSEQAKLLISKYLEGKATEEEKILVERFYLDQFRQEDTPENMSGADHIKAEIWNVVEQQIHDKPKHAVKRLWVRIAAAASILLAVSSGGYFLLHKQAPQQQVALNQTQDIAPGHNQATLTLAGGKKIILIKGLNGVLAQQGGTSIQASQRGITYTNTKAATLVGYNTLTTARGEQSPYPLILPDGTKVWLNAESSITFPTAFNGRDRIVKITGEALFEVSHNTKHPFKVQAGKQTIEDLGTTFDVNAYTDETSTKTTLVEGSVRVNGMVLKPNEQTDGTHIKTINVKRYIAWKNGDFDFEDDNIQTIMRQLSRWYNIEIKYEGNITGDGLTAQITRNRNISGILHILQNTKSVRFKIEGRRVTVIE